MRNDKKVSKKLYFQKRKQDGTVELSKAELNGNYNLANVEYNYKKNNLSKNNSEIHVILPNSRYLIPLSLWLEISKSKNNLYNAISTNDDLF